MKKLLILAGIAAMATACGPSKQQQQLQSSNDSLWTVVYQKDSIINEAFGDISQIAANIQEITNREKIVTTQAQGDITKPVKEQIADNIAAINKLLEQNRQTIQRLQASTSQLKAANVKIDALQKLVDQLQAQIEQKDGQIAELTKQVEALNIQVEALGRTVLTLEGDKSALQSTVSQQDAELHTAYYVVGQEKTLLQQEIIDKRGFIGRTRVLGNATDMQDFTRIDVRKVDRIKIGHKRPKIVSSHPADSYMLVVDDEGVTEELVITNREQFWSNSRILVISYR